MKKFRLDLSVYQVEEIKPKLYADGKVVRDADNQPHMIIKNVDYPLRDNLSVWLRLAGMFRTAEDVAEAVCLAKTIRGCIDDFINLDEKEASILRQVLDRLISLTADGKLGTAIGGELHEEAICRVVNMEEIAG